MPRKFSIEYVDRLLTAAAYEDLAALSSMICASSQFKVLSPDYGLPKFAFLFAETLLWFSQGARSGVWTYYEATSPLRQEAMARALRETAPKEFATWYERGMRDWRDESKIAAVDDWIEQNSESVDEWLRALVRRNRETLLELGAE